MFGTMNRIVLSISIVLVVLEASARTNAFSLPITNHQYREWRLTTKNSKRTRSFLNASQRSSSANTSKDTTQIKAIRSALEAMRAFMDAKDGASTTSSLAMTSLFQGKKSVVTVSQSSVPGAGMGLFAQEDIKAGTIISLYPVHGLGVDFGDSSMVMGLDPSDQDYFDNNPKDDYLLYLIGSRPLGKTTNMADVFGDAPLFVDANPSRGPTNTHWLSNYINDGAIVGTNTEQGIVDYYQLSRELKNCVLVPFGPSPIMASITTQDVSKGQELFTTYGCSYWIQYIGDGNEEMVDVTEQIQAGVQQTAQDLFQTFRTAQTKYAKEAIAFQRAFT
jgi:hypothetical protein